MIPRGIFGVVLDIPQVSTNTGGESMSLVVRKEVKDAIDAGQAVVALESTIISHGVFSSNVILSTCVLVTQSSVSCRVW